MTYPRYRLSRGHKFARRTAGSVVLTSATYADVDTALDMVLAAQVGDVIEYGMLGVFANENNSANFEVFSWVSSAAVNAWATSGGASAYSGWYKPAVATGFCIGGSVMRTLLAGDISAGYVTLRLRGRRDGATNVTVFATTDIPLNVWAKNLGPQDPN